MRPYLLSPLPPKGRQLILSAVDSYNLIYSLACVNMSKIAGKERRQQIVHFSILPFTLTCGEYRIRTVDPLLAKQVL